MSTTKVHKIDKRKVYGIYLGTSGKCLLRVFRMVDQARCGRGPLEWRLGERDWCEVTCKQCLQRKGKRHE